MKIVFGILAILLFGLLVILHELGHFMAAKLFGVRVEEFSLGMGPQLLKRQKGETLYSVRAVPFGGFCAMAGEDEESSDPRAFTSQSAWKRAVILISGPAMNFLMGFLMVALVYSSAYAFRAPIITDFMEGSPYNGTFQVGDRFVSINGHYIYQYTYFEDFIDSGSGVYDIVIKRDGKRIKLEDFEFVRVELPGESRRMFGLYFGYEEATAAVKLKNTWGTTLEFGRWVRMGLTELVKGRVGVLDMSGPVGIVEMMTDVGEQAENTKDGFFDIVYLGAFIAVNLAIMNLLPIPGLDGGRIFLLIITWLIESITHRKLNSKYEGYIHAAGMVLLLGLMAFVMFNDIIRIVTK